MIHRVSILLRQYIYLRKYQNNKYNISYRWIGGRYIFVGRPGHAARGVTPKHAALGRLGHNAHCIFGERVKGL